MDRHPVNTLCDIPCPSRTSSRRVCLVTPRSTATTQQLRKTHHDVTVVNPTRLPSFPFPLGGSLALAESYRVYHWLRNQSFDEVWFTDHGAPGYYSLLARSQGLAFASTRFGVIVEGPTLYRIEKQGAFLDQLDQLECDAVERRCMELADEMHLTDPDLCGWLQAHDWPTNRIGNVQVPTSTQSPLVSVCLIHHERPRLLRQALASLEAQDYPHFEIILVDDGSQTTEAKDCLAQLEPMFRARGWSLIRQSNRYLGAARNTAARHARGEYLLFMDDDNLAKPQEISTLIRAAQHSGADILTTFMDFFVGDMPHEQPLCRWLFAGIDSLVGVARNCYGDANALVRRSVFESLGGFSEDQGVTHEDWEFFAKAVLRGYTLEVVPEALFWYRQTPGSMIRSTPTARNYARSLRPFLEDVPSAYRDLLRLTQGLALSNLRSTEKPLRYRIADIVYSLGGRLLRRLGIR